MKKKCINGFVILCSAILILIGCKQTNDNSKVSKQQVSLVTLKIGDITKSGKDIMPKMDFGTSEESKLKVDCKASLPDAKFSFLPELHDGFWLLTEGVNELTITVNKGTETKEYTAKIIKPQPQAVDKEVITTVFVSGGYVKGVETSITDEQINDILSGKAVTVELTGPVARVLAVCDEKKWSSLKINGKDIDFKQDGFGSVGEAFINLPKQGEELKVKIEAAIGDKRAEVKFKIKRLKGAVDIMDMNLFIGGNLIMRDNDALKLLTEGPKPSYYAPDKVKIELMCRNDFIEAIEIDSKKFPMKSQKLEDEDVFSAVCELNDVAPNGRDVVLKVIPKNKEDYSEHTLNFHLAYKPAKSNAEFEFYKDAPNSPIITDSIEWVDDIKRDFPDDYGAKSVKITAHTAVKGAKVYYKFVHLDFTEDAEGNTVIQKETELSAPVKMTYKYKAETGQHQHMSDKIQLFTDKPTRLKIYVEAEDGSTDNNRGVSYAYAYNNVDLSWDYNDHSKGQEFQNTGYDVIKLNEDLIQNKKIYLAFRSLNGEEYAVDNSRITAKQTKFEKLDTVNTIYDWLKTEVDVSELTDNTKEIEVVCPILYKGKLAFTYKVKIKLQ